MSRLFGRKRGKSKGDNCEFCRQLIAKDKNYSGVFYSVGASEKDEGGKVHTECWEAYHEKTAVKCLHCQGPVAHLPGRFNGKHYVSHDPPGQVHSECWDEYSRAKSDPDTCVQCGEVLAVVEGRFSGNYVQLGDGVKLHAECRTAYHAANTAKCLQCSAPVAPEKGKFTGEYFEIPEDGRVHAECFEEYSEAKADKCLVCKDAVRKKEGFSGDFMLVSGNKVHKECASDYLEMVADKCLHCNKGVRKAGKYGGAFYPIDLEDEPKGSRPEGGKVHMECFEDYNAKVAANRREEPPS